MSELSPEGCGGMKQEFPVNQYGMQKLLAEKEALLAYARKPKDLLIGRLSWLFGNSSNSFVEKLIRSIACTYAAAVKNGQSGNIVHKVAQDAYGRPTPVWLVFDCILDAIGCTYNCSWHGVHDFQYSSCPQISRLEWAQMIWDAFCFYIRNASCTNEDTSDYMHDMLSRIVLEGVDSSVLNLGMKHPGRIEEATASCALDKYIDATKMYVESKVGDLSKMAYDVLKKELP